MALYEKQTKTKRTGDVAQMVERLPKKKSFCKIVIVLLNSHQLSINSIYSEYTFPDLLQIRV
jgi:hypothetical protein